MENAPEQTNDRSDFRYTFAANEMLDVQLETAHRGPMLRGRITNLSLGGMAVELNHRPPLLLPGSSVRSSFCLGRGGPRLNFRGTVIRVQTTGLITNCAIQFVPLADVVAEETRERHLWRFVLGKHQQQVRKQLHTGT